MFGLFISYQSRIQLLLPLETLESPLDCMKIQPVDPKGDQSWIFIGRLMLKLQYFGHLMWGTDSLEKTLMLVFWLKTGDWRQEEKGMTEDEMVVWMPSLTWWTWVWVSSGSWWWTRKPGVLQSVGSQRAGHNWATEWNWTTPAIIFIFEYLSTRDRFQQLILGSIYPLPHYESLHRVKLTSMLGNLAFRETADFRTGAEKVQDESGISWCDRRQESVQRMVETSTGTEVIAYNSLDKAGNCNSIPI